jgi:hypothetical protein
MNTLDSIGFSHGFKDFSDGFGMARALLAPAQEGESPSGLVDLPQAVQLSQDQLVLLLHEVQ